MLNNIDLSVVVPVYYGANTVQKLVDRLSDELTNFVPSFEIILVNDGSLDESDAICTQIALRKKNVRYFQLAKNFSEHNAVMAGLNFSVGNYAVIIDDDFQNPPEEIAKLYKKIKNTNVDVVFARYEKKEHHWFRNLGSVFNDKVANIMLGKPNGLYLCSFKILSRWLIDEIVKYEQPFPYIDGLILRSTQHIETELVKHDPRVEGKSTYTLRKLIDLWSHLFINFSLVPLRASLLLGFLFAAFGFLLAVYFIIEKLRSPQLPLGWASTIISILILSGVQLIVMGMIGEYLGRAYLGQTKTPQFVVRKRVESID